MSGRVLPPTVGQASQGPDWATHLQSHVATPPLQSRESALSIGPFVPRAEVPRGVRARVTDFRLTRRVGRKRALAYGDMDG
jgi:hypothetical protein